MATFSFTQNVEVKDLKVVNQIKNDLSKYKPAFDHVKPDKSPDNTKDVAKIWFKR